MLLQSIDSSWRPVAYASRSMSETEHRYAQIEEEALATTWACKKFGNFLIGKHFLVETDHKPLLGVKHLDTLPPQVLRFRLRLDRFNYDIKHVPGKELYTADTLSRAPIPNKDPSTSFTLQDLAEIHLPASDQRLATYKKAQSDDPQCKVVLQYCREGWPVEKDVDPAVRAYWDVQGELTIGDGLLLQGNRIVVPKALQALQKETLEKEMPGERCRVPSLQLKKGHYSCQCFSEQMSVIETPNCSTTEPQEEVEFINTVTTEKAVACQHHY